MSEIVKTDSTQTTKAATPKGTPAPKQPWETPKLTDVSEQVMAQPYIRFT
jgi:hypothetical protein